MAKARESAPDGPEATPRAEDLLSIGDLADATGIAPDTIRVWERRYGRPQAIRLPSGHRRYVPDDVRWLRRVAEALARGGRPGRVVRLSDGELDDLLAPRPASLAEAQGVRRTLRLLREVRLADLREELRRDAETLGPRAFLRERLGPLLTAVGRAWADGEVSIRHEHALTEVVEDVLREVEASVPRPPGGPGIVLATLPDERHGLGLRMVAVECAAAGVPTWSLGPSLPLEEIATAVAESGAKAVLLSVSLATGGIETDRRLADLRRLLPDAVRIVVGGAGARGVRRGPRGVEYVEDLPALERWLAAFRG